MRYLIINGEKKRIPAYPHHKDYIYRTHQFFEGRSLLSLIAINGVMKALRRVWMQRKYNYAIPFNLLIDPTSACNLKCTGCWAAGYEKKSEISYDKLDEILTDARKLGISDILFSGGEPLMRKDDILKLASKHRQLPFSAFTNGTLIDENFARQMAQLGNLNMFISIEGFEDATDFRRGKGTYGKALAAMDLLRKHDIGFGFSVCYHSKNYKEICSDDFLDFVRSKGAWMGWLFNYFPLGNDADMSLCTTAEQRLYVKEKIESYTERYNYTIIDFANAGHLAYGCVAAGNGFVHINPNGDLEPCAFFHYSDSNINHQRLTEALASPFFKHFRKAEPFSKNIHRPCPIMDVPFVLDYMSRQKGVYSTHLHSPESMSQLRAKTGLLAAGWKPVAEQKNALMTKKSLTKIKRYQHFMLFKDK